MMLEAPLAFELLVKLGNILGGISYGQTMTLFGLWSRVTFNDSKAAIISKTSDVVKVELDAREKVDGRTFCCAKEM